MVEIVAGPALVQLFERQDPLFVPIDHDRHQPSNEWKAKGAGASFLSMFAQLVSARVPT